MKNYKQQKGEDSLCESHLTVLTRAYQSWGSDPPTEAGSLEPYLQVSDEQTVNPFDSLEFS